ncbi:MAG: hypothetical protein ACQEWV_29145 [Bacillota bacterium]
MSRIRKTFPDKKGVIIESDSISDYVKFIQENNIEEIQISDLFYHEKGLEFLLSVPKIKKINVTSLKIKDYSSLYELNHLEELELDEPEGTFDFTKMKSNLKSLSLGWNKNVVGLGSLRGLNNLNISNYKSKQNEILTLLQSNLNLQSLDLNSCKVDFRLPLEESFNLYNLKSIEITKMESNSCNILINSSPNLESITLDKIRNGIDFLKLQFHESFKELVISGIKGVENIHLLNQYDQLERLVILKCTFDDNSLSDLKKEYIK